MDWLTAFFTSRLTLDVIALGAIALIIVSILRGWLIPSNTHLREIKQERDRAEDYKEMYQTANATNEVLSEVAKAQIVQGETMNKILRSLPSPHQEVSE